MEDVLLRCCACHYEWEQECEVYRSSGSRSMAYPHGDPPEYEVILSGYEECPKCESDDVEVA